MFDFRLPKPFMDPKAWRIPADEPILVDLRFYFSSGGPYRTKLDSVRDLVFTKSSMSPGEEAVVLHALEESGRLKSVSREFDSSQPTSFDWAKEVFSGVRSMLDEMSWRRLVQDYVGIRGGEVTALDDLRLLPAFAKKKVSLEVAFALEHELAKALALYSPQVETSKEGERLALNPTLQIATGGVMSGYFRKNEELHEATLDWQRAAVLDELHEHGKQSPQVLSESLDSLHANSSLRKTKSFEDVLREMSEAGLLVNVR